jgi:glycine dehydrogenase
VSTVTESNDDVVDPSIKHSHRPAAHHFGNENEFHFRHIGVSSDEVQLMCSQLDVIDRDELMSEVIPASIRSDGTPLSEPHSEANAIGRLQAYAEKNIVAKSFIGMGYNPCHTPNVILRNVLENPAWYTAYTPYQPEISQGRLEALLNFQTMVSDLTGFQIANASLLDEGTAAAEAMALCFRVTKSKSKTFFVSSEVHPQTIAILQTRSAPLEIEIVVGDHQIDLENEDFFGALFQYPASHGQLYDYSDAIKLLQEKNCMVVVAADLLSLTLLKSPKELGADVAVGTTQRMGVPMFFGGPHAAYFATHEKHKRALPGRIIGVSKDIHGNPALRMALQTREQHIRRDKATSNVCTAQALLAIAAGLFAVYHGPTGLTRIARRIQYFTGMLADLLAQNKWNVVNATWFDTLTVAVSDAESFLAAAHAKQVNFRMVDGAHIGISLDETTTNTEIQLILDCFDIKCSLPNHSDEINELESVIPDNLRRNSEFLTHPVFHDYQTETEMLRYLRKLSDKDLALDRTMIPLGSCTMKLNSTTEMIPVSWPEFSDIHPFAPNNQTVGYRELISDLETMLCDATGYDSVSLQPNAGSQGEFAGLLAIQAYHSSRNETHRNVCLIPQSAHGTNPASAKMAGMKIVVIQCDGDGNIDVVDLKTKATTHRENLSCMMITYPSTHGVFEENIRELCEIIHDHGGQVYIDGANLNAQVGLCEPGKYGGDVSHLNLHKTFCIPHGGGGPGVGPVAVRSHLAPFLPATEDFNGNPKAGKVDQSSRVGSISAAPFGSAGILPISWAYIYMMGSNGLKMASEMAILNANYIAKRLEDVFPVLYTGKNGRVAHECIIDIRPLTESTGITVDDVAKRMMDYGFHAPTMSFPVAGTLMIEPTESESKRELDRFCDAMIAIRNEIESVAKGVFDQKNNPLVNAPHTARCVSSDNWTGDYPRETAAFPLPALVENKYWPPVGRLDHAHGDRNLVCSCPDIESYES